MIGQITLKSGRSNGKGPQTINVAPVTVFVGPNNSGKSRALAEIFQFCRGGEIYSHNIIINSIDLLAAEKDKIHELIENISLPIMATDRIRNNELLVGSLSESVRIDADEYKEILANPNDHTRAYCDSYLKFKTIHMDGPNRIGMVKEQTAGDLQRPAESSFQTLFRDDKKRKEVRRIIFEAFGQYMVIDPTNLGRLKLRLSSRPPIDEMEERGIHEQAVNFHSNAIPIEISSDGVKAFTGMITQMIAGDPLVLLMDEPEAFLHPSLSFKLGKEVSNIMSHSDKRLFVSTHSSNFIMGCIQSGSSVNIVRLTYSNGVATSRLLPNNEILKLMRNPLLRSVGVLSALFYEYVVVTESDSDRAFYQEINDRLLRYSEGKGIPNCLFLNAQNKQTVKTIIKPLRDLGIPVAGIVDIDILKEGGSVWSGFLDSGFLPGLEKDSLANLRKSINRKFSISGKDMKRDGGVSVLEKDDQESLINLLSKLAQYGLFVVPNGELESWLAHLEVKGHGPNWLVSVFEKIGEDPSSPDFLLPSEGDVWSFLEKISEWFFNPNRSGIPD